MILLCCLVLLVAAPGSAARSPELMVNAPAEYSAFAAQVAEIGKDDFTSQLDLVGLPGFGGAIQVVVLGEETPVAQETPSWISGYARGNRGVIVLFPQRVPSYPDRNLRMLVHHEVAHVLIARAARGRAVPRWFNEGLATVAAREWGLEDRARFAMTVIGERPHNVDVLDRWFRSDGHKAVRAYALSSGFIRFLLEEHGQAAPARILEALSRDESFERAFLLATGTTLYRAEKVFFDEQVVWNTWIPFLTSSGALWMGITILALIAIKRRRDRSRVIREAWDEEETKMDEVESPEIVN